MKIKDRFGNLVYRIETSITKQISDNQKRKEELERMVKIKTPTYISINHPQYDADLIEAHLELVQLYHKEGNLGRANSHFQEAETEFFNMVRVETKKPKYLSKENKYLLSNKKEETKGSMSLSGYKSKLINVAEQIGLKLEKIADLICVSTKRKGNLTDLVKNFYNPLESDLKKTF